MKDKLRKDFLYKRDQLSKEEILKKSKKITSLLTKLPEFKKAKTIMVFVSFKSEVFTHELIKECLKKGKRVAVPITNFKDKTMEASELKDFDNELVRTGLGLYSLKKEFLRVIPKSELDLVLVPGAVFDEKGNRLGMGLGYYDRFLQEVNERIPLIALLFELQLVKELPCEAHDIPVHKIVTEKRVIECKC